MTKPYFEKKDFKLYHANSIDFLVELGENLITRDHKNVFVVLDVRLMYEPIF